MTTYALQASNEDLLTALRRFYDIPSTAVEVRLTIRGAEQPICEVVLGRGPGDVSTAIRVNVCASAPYEIERAIRAGKGASGSP